MARPCAPTDDEDKPLARTFVPSVSECAVLPAVDCVDVSGEPAQKQRRPLHRVSFAAQDSLAQVREYEPTYSPSDWVTEEQVWRARVLKTRLKRRKLQRSNGSVMLCAENSTSGCTLNRLR